MSSTTNVTLYSTPMCSWCRVAKDYLKKNSIRFKEIDVSRDQRAAMDMVKRTGQMGVPVIIINNKPVIGFDKNRIDQLLNIKSSPIQ